MTREQRRRNRIAGITLLMFAIVVFTWTLVQGGKFIVGFSGN
jgi:hypothetical protein